MTSLTAYAGWRRSLRHCEHSRNQQIQAVRKESEHLCFSTLEALTYALEAGDPDNVGHLDCVQRIVTGLSKAFALPQEEADALRAAALLHNVGRLGIPDSIWNKADALSPEEQEKLRSHPVLGARILASIPFPWNVVPLVRHHAEHWDGSGYPDGLIGSRIPLGSRILAVANAYSALQRPRSFRPALSSLDALAEIEAQSGAQFDPGVVNVFRSLAAQFRVEAESHSRKTGVQRVDVPPGYALLPRPAEQDARAWLHDITAAQRETQGLARLADAVSGSQHLESVSQTLLASLREIVPCDACVLFLPENDGEFLRGVAAHGLNERHLVGSVARVGTYLTGRAFSQGQSVVASFLPDDLNLRDVSETWTPMRSTLIVPLHQNGQPLGTLNLYAQSPDAFSPESQRVMRLVATQAARAVENARRFDEVHESAYTDAMTGLRNARYLREYLERETNRALRDGTQVAVLTMDLDNFKPINDRFGHGRGDQILRDCGELLTAQLRNYDLAARYAGDEFVVVLCRTDSLQAEIVATKLRLAVEKHGHKLCAREPGFPQIGMSVGVALFPADAEDLPTLLCRSDAAMYADKQQRRAARPADDCRAA